MTSVLGSSPRRGWATVGLAADELYRVRRKLGGTLNDVVLSVVAGGLRDWMLQHGDAATVNNGGSVRAFIPVSVRARRAVRHGGGNRFSGYLCDLPVGEPDPIARVRIVHEAMEHNKARGPTRGAGAFPLVAEVLPAAVHRMVTPMLGRAAPLLFDAMVTTVPVPDIPLRLDGAELRSIHPIAPLASGHALSVAATAYRGTVQVGLLTDPDLMPGTARLGGAIAEAATDLCEHAQTSTLGCG